MYLKIGSRASKLALAQSHEIGRFLQSVDPSIRYEIVPFSTKGDKILDKTLHEIGQKGLFTQEIEDALRDKKIDLAVHSLKDLPSQLDPMFCLAPFCLRADPSDCFISNSADFYHLPSGSIIGTGSLRRELQLKALRNDLVYRNIRGNVLTRLKKLDEGEYDGLVLASAGLKRLGLEERITQVFTKEECLGACGQGVLAVELLAENQELYALFSKLKNEVIDQSARIERAFLTAMDGSCHTPIGALYDGKSHTLNVVYGDAASIGRYTFQEKDPGRLLAKALLSVKGDWNG